MTSNPEDSNIREKFENEAQPIHLHAQAEHMLQNAILMTELGIDLKERISANEKYVCYLRSLAVRAGKTMNVLQTTSRSFLVLAQKLVTSAIATFDSSPISSQIYMNIKMEYERLSAVIERELSDVEDIEALETSVSATFANTSIAHLAEKIKYLEAKQKLTDNPLLPHSGSTKSVKSDVDEKYPENLSRESLIDLNNVGNLPTVLEDTFTNFANRPARTSSLSSLKSMRKIKLFLQRASNTSDEDDESSEAEEHDLPKLVGDCDDVKCISPSAAIKKAYLQLGNIKEETQQD